MDSLETLRFPIGRWQPVANPTPEQCNEWIDRIEQAPSELRAAVAGISAAELATPYRPDGWTLRQVVHHLPDSHMNAYIRFRMALTEDEPTVKPYDEKGWAELPDGKSAPIDLSLDLFEQIHNRLVILLRSLDSEAMNRRFIHPEDGILTIAETVGVYAWHGDHHIAHIRSAR